MQMSMTKMTSDLDLCCDEDPPHLLILLYCINYSDSREVVLLCRVYTMNNSFLYSVDGAVATRGAHT